MTKKNKINVFIAGTLALFCLSSCLAAKDIFSDILEGYTETITVGMLLDCPPFEFLDESGKPAGFNVDIANSIAASLRVGITIEKIELEDVFMVGGNFDMIISHIPQTNDLIKDLVFSEPYFQSSQAIIINERNTDIQSSSLLDAQTKTIVVINGSRGEKLITEEEHFANAKIEFAQDEADALAILTEKADAFIYDRHFAQHICLARPQWRVLPDKLTTDYYCVILPGGTSTSLLNNLISELKLSAAYIHIFNKWFGSGRALR